MRKVRERFWAEVAAGGSSLVLALLTVLWHDWIEVTGWDPDNHSGAVEWLVVVALAAVSAGAAVLARYEWRRAAPA